MKPLITKESVVAYLRKNLKKVEVFDTVPTDKTTVQHGVYVSNPLVSSVTAQSLGFTPCGTIRDVVDSIDVIVVSNQEDDQLHNTSDVITNIPYSDLKAGYIQISFSTDRDYFSVAEYRTYSFELQRVA
jgi:hypothetical protein